MKKYFKKNAILFYLTGLLVWPYITFAASPAFDNLKNVGEGGNLGLAPYQASDTHSLSIIVSIVIQAFLGLLGIIFLILIIYAGYNWMTAQGDEEKVTKAKDTIQRAIIGLIIIILAYSITFFVFSNLPEGDGGADVDIE